MALAQWLNIKKGQDSLAFKELERGYLAFWLVSHISSDADGNNVEERRPLIILQKIQAAIVVSLVSENMEWMKILVR